MRTEEVQQASARRWNSVLSKRVFLRPHWPGRHKYEKIAHRMYRGHLVLRSGTQHFGGASSLGGGSVQVLFALICPVVQENRRLNTN